MLFFYGFETQFFLYVFQYRAFRNFNYFLIWIGIGIGIIHFLVFLQIKDCPELAFINMHSASGLRSTIITLLLFQILRFLSLKIQKKELKLCQRNPDMILMAEELHIRYNLFYGIFTCNSIFSRNEIISQLARVLTQSKSISKLCSLNESLADFKNVTALTIQASIFRINKNQIRYRGKIILTAKIIAGKNYL